MKALLDAMQFKQIMDGVKHAVCTDNSRPVLGYIKLDIKGETITAYALDGYRLAKVVVTNTDLAPNNKDEFSVLIKPIAIPKKVAELGAPVEIEKDDSLVTVTMQTYDGKTVFNYEQPTSEFIDAEKVIADAGAHDRELAANGKYVADAMTAISKSTHDRNNCAVIQTKADNCKAFIITGKGQDTQLEQELAIAQGTKSRLTIFDRIELHDKVAKSTAKDILSELGNFIGSRQKFCIVDEQRKELIEVGELFGLIGKLTKKYMSEAAE